VYAFFCCVRFSFFHTKPGDSLGMEISEMTYFVSSGAKKLQLSRSVSVAMAQSSSDNSALCYILSALWMIMFSHNDMISE